MEGKEYLLLTILILLNSSAIAQNNQSIYQAYVAGNMGQWKSSMDSIDAIERKTSREVLDLINYQYGYIGWCVGIKKNDEAKKLLRKAADALEQLEEKRYNESMIYAYKAAFVGFEILMAPHKAPFIGPKSLGYAKKSITLDASNALAYVQLGNIAYYTPKLFGGSKDEAIKHYLKALKIMGTSSEYSSPNWNYLNLLIALINAYMDTNLYEAAKKYCLKTLALEPGFDWVKNNLYPQVLKNLKE